MKIVVMGGTGLIGTKVVTRLTEQGHQTLTASPNTGVDATTGQGLADALAGEQVVVDLSVFRGGSGPRLLRELGPQSRTRGARGLRPSSRRPLGGRHRPPAG